MANRFRVMNSEEFSIATGEVLRNGKRAAELFQGLLLSHIQRAFLGNTNIEGLPSAIEFAQAISEDPETYDPKLVRWARVSLANLSSQQTSEQKYEKAVELACIPNLDEDPSVAEALAKELAAHEEEIDPLVRCFGVPFWQDYWGKKPKEPAIHPERLIHLRARA